MLLGSSVNAFVMKRWSKGVGRDEQIGVAAKWPCGGGGAWAKLQIFIRLYQVFS